MVILGIDPGYAITGFGVVDYSRNRLHVIDYGVISTKANTPFRSACCRLQTRSMS
jgi:crossover junction endodeoxyribonuclease RuvC